MDEKRILISKSGDLEKVVSAVFRSARNAGFKDAEQFMIATAASELARNILSYAGRGIIIIRSITTKTEQGIEVVAEDKGPGIQDIKRAMEDHFSTGGTLGIGLPGAKRLMDELEINTDPGSGTTVIARKWIKHGNS